ncbi:unnamed protein product [Rhodiola kirilowii]
MSLSPAGVQRKIMEVAETRFRDESNKEEEFSRTRNVSRAEPPSNAMAKELKQMKEMMQQLMRRQPIQVKPCEFCGTTDHKTDACPSLQEDTHANVNAQGSYNNQNQYQQRGQYKNQAGPNQQGKPLEDIVRELAASVHQFQAKTDGAIADLSKQMSQIATTVSELKNDPGRLPSQTVPNLRGNVNTLAVVDVDAALKESTYWVNKMLALDGHIEAENEEDDSGTVLTASAIDISSTLMSEEDAPIMSSPDAVPTDACSKTDFFPSFSMQVIAPKDHMVDKDELGGRLEARHEKNKPIMERPLATSHEAPLEKSKDPSAFTVTCGIGETQIHHCLIDLGAAINAIPYSLYWSLNLGPLKPPKLLVELGHKSCVRPIGL